MPPRVALAVPIEDLAVLYRGGRTLAELARLAKVSAPTVRDRLAEAGIPMRKGGQKPRNLDVDRLRALRQQGMSTREMAAILECSEECVRETMKRNSIPRLPGKARPEKNGFWRGGYTVDKHGYLLRRTPGHPGRTRGGYVRVHRLVMEEHLGRYLSPGEVVDHRDGDTSNNDLRNLVLYPSNGAHLRATRTGRKKLPAEQREALRREAVRRARLRLASILAES